MATKKNTDFLHFNAYSIKEMIVRKLTEDTKYTDQVYEGSNLNILIDLVSYMYQSLMYCLNNAAAESMFADTQIYENMNRLVKFLGYNPKGIVPSSGYFYIDNTDAKYAEQYILKYSYVDTGVQDIEGRNIYYSTNADIHIDSTGKNQTFKFNMLNGKWEHYHTVFEATGTDYETFILDDIGSNTELMAENPDMLVANDGIHVYVEHEEMDQHGNVNTSLTQFNAIQEELFINTNYDENITSYARIYTRYDNIVNVRLSENKTYTLKFGNGIVGRKLQPGDKVHVMYFRTNGTAGRITIDDYPDGKKLVHNASAFGISTNLYDLMFSNKDYSIASSGNDQEVDVYLSENTSVPNPEESVDEIRESAPNWFKMGQRLITAQDYEFYIKNLRKGEVIDVVCQNNFEYAATFYKWLLDLGVEKHIDEGAEQYYLNRNTLAKYGYTYADPVDMNNTYIWVKMTDNGSIQSLKQQYIEEMQKIKCLTTNIIFHDAINMNFSVTAMPEEKVVELLKTGDYQTNEDSYIEVTMNNNIMYASSVIAEQICTIIQNFFNAKSHSIGKTVNYNDLVEKIYAINGIERIRTVYLPNNDVRQQRVIDGLSFATWSDSVIDTGDDIQVGNSARSLHEFHYPVFFDTNLQKRIKVIKKSINVGVRIQY